MLTASLLLLSFILTGASLCLLRPLAARVGLVDVPGGRKTHISATPLVGGLGIYFSILVITIISPEILATFGPLLSLSALIVFIGVIDDARELKVYVRMTGHILVAIAMVVVAGNSLVSFGDILGTGPINLGAASLPLTVFATVGVINAINMSDGVDGLSGGLVIVVLVFIAITTFQNGNEAKLLFIGIIVCAIIAFLTQNFRRPWSKKALVYLGDAGSTMLGFVLAWLLIESSQGVNAEFQPVYALWFLAVPLLDTVNLLIRRPLKGLSPVHAGLDHLHHSLLERGLSSYHVVALLLTASIIFGSVGMIGIALEASESLMFLLFILLFVVYFILSPFISPKK